MTITTEDVTQYLENFISNSQPKNQTDIDNPNYAIYALAPFWLPHQALCLLAGIKTIEVHTFRTCLALNSLQLKMNSILAVSKSEPSGKNDFCDYVISHFPTKLSEASAHRDKIDMLYLPKIFPDEINPYGKWTSLRMNYNLSKPNYPLGGIPGFAFTSPPDKQDLDEKSNSETDFSELDKSILTERGQEIYHNALRVRKLCIGLYLKNQFGEGAIDYNNLIDQLGAVEEEEFKIYNKAGPWPRGF